MADNRFNLLDNKHMITKILLFAAVIILIVIVLPKEGRFRYEFSKGKPWLHNDLYAPFDFAIIKFDEELKAEQEQVLASLTPFFNRDTNIAPSQKLLFENEFEKKWTEKYGSPAAFSQQKKHLLQLGSGTLDTIFRAGIIQLDPSIENKPADFEIFILEKNTATRKKLSKVFTLQQASQFIINRIGREASADEDLLINILTNHISHNLFFNAEKTQAEQVSALNNISPFRGMVQRGELIIPRGARVNDENFRILTSLKSNYEEQLGAAKALYAIAGGQIILTSISILVLILFLYNYRKDILANNKRTGLILLVIFVCFFKYTRWGLAMQATADDEMAALSLGVSARYVYAAAWAIAFMAAGVGGTLLGNINGLNISVAYLGLLVLPVVVLGGLNSVPGAILGGIIIGVLQNFCGAYLDQYFPGGVKEIAPFAFMVVFLLWKPYGIWGWERIERV